MKRTVALLMIAALVAPWGFAQQPPAQQPPPIDPRRAPAPPPSPQQQTAPTIRSFADLVLLDVQVVDRNGKPVKGLKQEQFTISENDKQQKISTFDYYDIETIETAGSSDQRPIALALGTVAPPEKLRETVRDRRMVVLFFDMTSMQQDELLRAVASAEKYINDQMTAADIVAIVTFGNRLSVLSNFTNNRDYLRAAVNTLRPGKDTQLSQLAEAAASSGQEAVTEETGAAFTADETEFNIFNTDRKLAALEGICNMLRNIPGRKAVIQFAGGITQTGEENRSQLRSVTDAANRANVSVYSVDARGLQAAAPGGDAATGAAAGTAMFSGAAVQRQTSARSESRDTLATLASDTGGKSFFDVGDFKEVFDQVQDDASGYYLVGYYSSDSRRDGRWRTIKVRVDGRGVNLRVRHREGYYAPKDYGVYTAEDRERQLDEAMRSETPRVELALAMETTHFRLNDSEIFVPIAVKLAASALEWAQKRGRREAEFDFAVEVRDRMFNRPMAAFRDTMKVKLDAERLQMQRALVYQGGVILGPGAYRMKLLARENETGRIGTFEQDFLLPGMQEGRLQLSSLMLSSQVEPVRQSGVEVDKKALAQDAKMNKSPLEISGERVIPSVTRVFTTQQKMYVLFQAYLPSRVDAAKLRAGLVFFRNGQQVSETPMVEATEVDTKTRTAVFRLSLPLEKFPPGRYSVQAVAIEAGGEQAAFAKNYFALRTPPAPQAPAAAPASAPGQE